MTVWPAKLMLAFFIGGLLAYICLVKAPTAQRIIDLAILIFTIYAFWCLL